MTVKFWRQVGMCALFLGAGTMPAAQAPHAERQLSSRGRGWPTSARSSRSSRTWPSLSKGERLQDTQFLQKPFTSIDLLIKVRHLLSGHTI